MTEIRDVTIKPTKALLTKRGCHSIQQINPEFIAKFDEKNPQRNRQCISIMIWEKVVWKGAVEMHLVKQEIQPQYQQEAGHLTFMGWLMDRKTKKHTKKTYINGNGP